MRCCTCHSPLEEKVSFRSTCPHCDKDLHTCNSCQFYLPGKPADCRVPNVDKVLDKEKNNFCEEFAYSEKPWQATKSEKNKIAKQLFKDEGEEKPSKNFKDLFKD